MRLEGKVALITGASRGLGRAIALAFAAEGCDVTVNYVAQADRDNAAEAAAVVVEIERLGRRALALEASVTDLPRVQQMVTEAIGYFGHLDILVNNAGITRDRTVRKLTPEDWDAVLAANLTGAFNCTKAVLEHMVERGSGRIISVSSVVGLEGNFGQANYAASKAGLIGFSKSLAREVARKGITVNCVAPGFIETGMTAVIPDDVRARIVAGIPMGRMGEPEEVAQAAVFLASDEASYITGHVLSINGGMHM